MNNIFSSLRKSSSDRQARINKLKTMIQNKDNKTEEQIIAQFCYEEAVSIRIANEYLRILELAGILSQKT